MFTKFANKVYQQLISVNILETKCIHKLDNIHIEKIKFIYSQDFNNNNKYMYGIIVYLKNVYLSASEINNVRQLVYKTYIEDDTKKEDFIKEIENSICELKNLKFCAVTETFYNINDDIKNKNDEDEDDEVYYKYDNLHKHKYLHNDDGCCCTKCIKLLQILKTEIFDIDEIEELNKFGNIEIHSCPICYKYTNYFLDKCKHHICIQCFNKILVKTDFDHVFEDSEYRNNLLDTIKYYCRCPYCRECNVNIYLEN